MRPARTAMKLTVIGDLLLSVSTAGSEDGGVLSDADMKEFLRNLRHAPITKYVAGMYGTFKSSSVQRKEGSELVKSRGIATAVVTDDRIVRGFVTAMSWLGAKVSAFSWAEREAALKHLGVEGSQAQLALSTFNMFRTALGIEY